LRGKRGSADTIPEVGSISVVGLGKLGLCIAALLANRGFEVIGVDVDRRRIADIKAGEPLGYEPGLPELLRATRNDLEVTVDLGEAVRSSQATFVVVPTPSHSSGAYSLKHVELAMQGIGLCLRNLNSYHLVVLCSTVSPGSTGGRVREVLEGVSGKRMGRDFGLCYNPEFIALGDVLAGLTDPDFVLIGENDVRAGDMLVSICRRMTSRDTPFERMNFLNAELTKIAVNSFVTMKISFANTLAEICEKSPGGDVDRVTRALGRDHRIGGAYLKGGLGYGGPCFPRDNAAFASYAKGLGVDAALARATDATNKRQLERLAALITGSFPARSKLGVFGITYKPKTDITEASQPLMLADMLASNGYEVHVYDPIARPPRGKSRLIYEASMESCLRNSDIFVLASPWEGFSKIEKSKLARKTVLDCWRVFNGNKPDTPDRYIALGKYIIPTQSRAKLS
jgi:UDPglucose 6-dehydrogenase